MGLLLRKSSGNGIIWIVRLCHSTPIIWLSTLTAKLRVFIKKDQTGGAYAIDYPPITKEGIVYPASENNPNDAWWKLPDMQHVFMHEMGHCVQWMPNKENISWKVCGIVTDRDIRKDGRTL